ncbi:hypothetical protein [Actinomyces sp. ZJ308]|uniref:hypothetical protein n=1 Tax=Actinomyces sp. ZJ308 TaxID=2708342 RepID=UPI001AB04D57|nr:hypothetical protein [Actinomyces sp. ZJ308]
MRLVPVAGVVALGLFSAKGALGLWYATFTRLDASAGELLTFAMAALGLGAFFAFDLLQRVTRSFFPDVAQTSTHPPRHRADGLSRLLPPRFRSAGSWGSRLALITVLVTPSLVLSGSAYLAYDWDRSEPYPVAAPAVLPSYPVSLPSEATWTHDIHSVLDVTAGAAGPLVLTDDSLLSLDPSTGRIRWEYDRQGKKFAQHGVALDGVRGEPPYLITSPDRRHVAVTLGELDSSEKNSDNDLGLEPALTIVLDTVTGRVTNVHFNDGVAVQLTDSVLLAGSTVYSLADDSVLWKLSDVEADFSPATSSDRSPYTGTGGHASLMFIDTIGTGERNGTGRITLVPDTNPRDVSLAIPTAFAHGSPLVVDGWTITYTDMDQDELSSAESSYMKAHSAQAVSLDALAKVPGADTRTYDLGQTLGIAPMTSRLSGRLAVLPATAPVSSTPENRLIPNLWTDQSLVATTFNPRTRAVLPASQDPGLVTAVGITRADDGQGRISLQSGDKSNTTSIPLENGTVSFVPGASGHNPGLFDFPVDGSGQSTINQGKDISALSTPGVTVVLLRPTNESWTTGTRLRLYGLVGASS